MENESFKIILKNVKPTDMAMARSLLNFCQEGALDRLTHLFSQTPDYLSRMTIQSLKALAEGLLPPNDKSCYQSLLKSGKIKQLPVLYLPPTDRVA